MKHYYVAIVLLALLAFIRGEPTSRVVGGQAAAKGQFPYQVQLRLYSTHWCGGSIIDKRWILTAAHCIPSSSIDKQNLLIVVGAHEISSFKAHIHKPEDFIVHKKFYIPSTFMINYDIALIRVSKDIQFGDNVRKVNLPKNDFDKFNGLTATLSGWGTLWYNGSSPDVLQYADLKIIDQQMCNDLWMEFDNQGIDDNKICTVEPGYGPCHGDSGGPLVINNTQIGIVSYGYPCATGVPSVFTRVSSYIDWIKRYTYP